MNDKKVTIVVMTYNHENYIAKALDSIIMQKRNFEIEVLVGNDASTDNTGAIIDSYSEKYPYITHINREKNLGIAMSAFDLISRITTPYIAVLDGDDYWLNENKLQQQYDFLESNPEYVSVFTQNTIVDETDNRHEEIEQYMNFCKNQEYTLNDFLAYTLPGQTSTLFTRNFVINKLEIMKTLYSYPNIQADMITILFALSIGKINIIQEPLSSYRYLLNSTNWSSKYDNHKAESVSHFCKGLTSLERIGQVLNQPIDFDHRRKYEIHKIVSNISERNDKDYQNVIAEIINDSHTPKKLQRYTNMLYVKYIIKRHLIGLKRIIIWKK